MENRAAFVIFIILLGALILADAYNVASLTINATVIALAAILVLSIALGASVEPSPRIRRATEREGSSSPRGPIHLMMGRVDGATAGYSFSREEIANLLASAFLVRSEEVLHPGYSSIQDARGRLMSMAGSDTNVRKVFEDYRRSQTSPPRFKRKSEKSDYLSGLESAIRLVQEGSE